MDPDSDPFRIPSYSLYNSYLHSTLNLIARVLNYSDFSRAWRLIFDNGGTRSSQQFHDRRRMEKNIETTIVY